MPVSNSTVQASGPASPRQATPELLYLLAHDEAAPPELRLAAAERAASLNVIAGEDLARAYREAAAKLPKAAQSGPALRARLFAAFESAPSANIRAESIAALLAIGPRSGDRGACRAGAGGSKRWSWCRTRKPISSPRPASGSQRSPATRRAPGPGSTPAASACGAGSFCSRRAIRRGRAPKPRSRPASIIALKGGLPPPLLHRLVTVLDALDYEVPIPLWDEASKTPQPTDGDLPPTGALTSLKQAADAGDVGRTVLIAAAVLGPNGARGANLIALGDALRALKRVGLDAEARRLGFEALYAHWPTRGKA